MSFGADKETFSVDVIGEKTGKQYVGEFTAKRLLSHRDQIVRDAKRREYLGPINPHYADDRTMNAAEVFGDLAVRIVKGPSFWQESAGGLDLVDDNVITEIYKLAIAFESTLLKGIAEKAEKAKKDLREQEEAAAKLMG